MSERESALATLSAIASSPDAIAASQAHLIAALDALVAVYRLAQPDGLTPPMQAMRSQRGAWMSVFTHAQHRVAMTKAAP